MYDVSASASVLSVFVTKCLMLWRHRRHVLVEGPRTTSLRAFCLFSEKRMNVKEINIREQAN